MTFASSAAAKDNITTTENNGAAFSTGNNGNETPFTALEKATLSIVSIDNRGKKNFTYGYYVYNEDGSLPDITNLGDEFTIGSVSSSQTEIDSPWTKNFEKDEMVGFWIKEGDTYYLTDPSAKKDSDLEELITSTDNGTVHNKDTDAYAFYGQNKTHFDVKIYFNGVGTENVGIASTGSPLPGVWATIALAGAASAYLKRRRKENK